MLLCLPLTFLGILQQLTSNMSGDDWAAKHNRSSFRRRPPCGLCSIKNWPHSCDTLADIVLVVMCKTQRCLLVKIILTQIEIGAVV